MVTKKLVKGHHPARGLAWMVTLCNRMSVLGLKVFSCTGTFSKSSSVSHPSMTLSGMIKNDETDAYVGYIILNPSPNMESHAPITNRQYPLTLTSINPRHKFLPIYRSLHMSAFKMI